jgi:hypothetical protein
MEPVNATDSNFEDEVLKSELPALIDVRAPWRHDGSADSQMAG